MESSRSILRRLNRAPHSFDRHIPWFAWPYALEFRLELARDASADQPVSRLLAIALSKSNGKQKLRRLILVVRWGRPLYQHLPLHFHQEIQQLLATDNYIATVL